MKAIPFKIVKEASSTILQQTDEGPYFYDRLHYHPEFQITSIMRGQGIVYGGNSTRNFGPGDVLFFGGNMPHLLKNTAAYYAGDSPGVLSYSLFFGHDGFGKDFFSLGELTRLSRFLEEARRGLIYRQNSVLAEKIRSAHTASGERLIVRFLDVLVTAMEQEREYINTEVYRLSLDEHVGDRLNRILNYTFDNLGKVVRVEDVARIANLSQSQFSRYFKRHTGKSFIRFVNELRIEESCRLLSETDRTIDTICYTCGFQNVSNFNRQFKKVKGITPRMYRASLKH